jgi:hypothetical protein
MRDRWIVDIYGFPVAGLLITTVFVQALELTTVISGALVLTTAVVTVVVMRRFSPGDEPGEAGCSLSRRPAPERP